MLGTILKLVFKSSVHKSRKQSTRSRKKSLPNSKSINGKARVIDGDSIVVRGYSIRLEGLDAPELKQPATSIDGRRFDHGALVKRVLQKRIEGEHVTVRVSGYDRYRRVLGSVYLDNLNVNAWLVRNGYAISAYGNMYKREESIARKKRLGQWGYAETCEPQHWRKQNRSYVSGSNRSQGSRVAKRLIRGTIRRQRSKLWRL